MALSAYVEKRFGRRTRTVVNPVTDSCLTTATVLLRNNPDRLAAHVVNLGANAMYLAWDRDVGSAHGVYVAPSGGEVVLLADEDGELVGYELFGLALVGADDVFILEVEAE